MTLMLLLILLPCLLGLLVVKWFWPEGNGLIQLSIAPGIGIGISSCLFFIGLLLFNEATGLSLVFEVSLILFLGWGISRSERHQWSFLGRD